MLRCACLLVAIAAVWATAIGSRVSAADLTPANAALASPSPPAWLSPFCPVSLYATPWDAVTNAPAQSPGGSVVRLRMYSQEGGTLEAHVTLVSDAKAYDVHVSSLALTGQPYHLMSVPILVILPENADVEYAYVDSYATNGGTLTPCATYVNRVSVWKPDKPGDRLDPPDTKETIPAAFRQALPPAACGKPYVPARYVTGGNVRIGHFGDRRSSPGFGCTSTLTLGL